MLQIENRNFMEDCTKKLNGNKYIKENLMLDKKIKTSKSFYAAESLEKDFEKILSYKKIIMHKNSLYFDSPKNARSSIKFYSNKKSSDVISILPKLGKGDIINPNLKTTSTNFLKNNNIQENENNDNNNLNKLLKDENYVDLKENNISTSPNPLISQKTISYNNPSSIISKDKIKRHLFFSQTTNNFRNSNDEFIDNIYTPNYNSNFMLNFNFV